MCAWGDGAINVFSGTQYSLLRKNNGVLKQNLAQIMATCLVKISLYTCKVILLQMAIYTSSMYLSLVSSLMPPKDFLFIHNETSGLVVDC